MNRILFILFIFCISLKSTSAQNDAGEGDVISEQNYIVEDLFTKLPLSIIQNRAKVQERGYYIDFSADWCHPCQLMDETTFRDYEVVKFSKENFYAVQLDMTDFDAIEMQAMYNISSLPTILFFNHNGTLIGRSSGLQTGTLFLKKLKEINALLF